MRHTRLLAMIGAAALSATLVAAHPLPPRLDGPHQRVEELSELLTRAVLPLDGGVCGVRLELPDAAPLDTSCAPAVDAATGADADDGQLRTRDAVRTPRWQAQLARFGGSQESFVRFHGYGDVALHGPDGEQLWNRAGMSFYDDWDIDNVLVPFVLMGSSPIDPWTRAGDRTFAVGDLTGDGVDDVALAHHVIIPLSAESEDLEEGDEVRSLSAVTVLDGRDGTTRWSRLYPGYVTHVLAVDGVLVVADETGDELDGTWSIGQDGTTTALHALTFAGTTDGLTATELWTHDLGRQFARWLAVEPAAPGRMAVSWTDKELGAGGVGGHLLTLELGTGAVVWENETTTYPRAVRYDATRDRLYVHEQADPVNTDERLDYWVSGYNAETGVRSARLERRGAVLLSFTLGDVVGDERLEVLTGDLEQQRVTPAGQLSRTFQASRVIAADGDNPQTLWTHRVEMLEEFQAGRATGLASMPLPYGLAVSETFEQGRLVLSATQSAFGDGLRALRGVDGGTEWERWGNVAYPLSLMTTEVDDTPGLLAMTSNKVLRTYAVGSGDTLRDLPVLADVYASETLDLDADGTKDLLVGGESGAVFALDGTQLGDTPRVLWRTTVGEGVRSLEVADLDGDGTDELVVAASSALVALDPIDGAVRWRHESPDAFVWTFALGELDDRPGLDVVVNTDTLTALGGSDGEQLWRHVPSQQYDTSFSVPAITPDGMVVAQYLIPFPAPFAPRHHRFMVGLDAATGAAQWQQQAVEQFGIVRQWRSVTAVGPTEDGAGTQVALTWDVKEHAVAAVARWRPRTDVVDSRTGASLWSVGPLSSDAVHMGTLHQPGRGLFEFNWFNVTRLEPDGGRQVDFEPAADVAWADLGDQQEGFVRGWAGVSLYAPDEPNRADGHFPVPVATWDELFVGRLHVDDVDGDGGDELVAVPFDWPGYARVAATEGTGVTAWDYLPHGVAVIDLAP